MGAHLRTHRHILAVALAVLGLLAAHETAAGAAAEGAERWRSALDVVERRRGLIARRLEKATQGLRAALVDRPDLVARLDEEPPKLETGWGLLPPLVADASAAAAAERPTEARYSIVELQEWATTELGRVASIQAALGNPKADLAAAVEDQRLACENLRRIDAHVAYHEFWQPEAAKYLDFFAAHNRLLAAWRSMSAGSTQDAHEARLRLERDVLGFAPTSGILVERGHGGTWTIVVPITTDIQDDAFLAAFDDGVERTWNQAPAMREAGLRIAVEWTRRAPGMLYPEGPPSVGEDVDLSCHRWHFDAPFVLTTGAESTHSFDRAILLGTTTLTPHVLAHELGHLLGFSDGYLRAHEGRPGDPDGVVFVEIRDLGTDLMSNPGTGLVTRSMVDRIVGAYVPPPAITPPVGATGG